MRGKPAKDDIVLVTKIQDIQRFMRFKTIANEKSRSFIDSSLGLRIEHIAHPIQADTSVGITSLEASIMPSRRGMGRSRTSMSSCGPYDKWMDTPTVGRYTFNGSDQGTFDRDCSMFSHVIPTY